MDVGDEVGRSADPLLMGLLGHVLAVADRAASCMEMPSASAWSRSAACSSGVSLSVMAMSRRYQTDTTRK